MSIPKSSTPIDHVNAHGTAVRLITVHTPELVIEFSYQLVGGTWVRFRRVAYTVH